MYKRKLYLFYSSIILLIGLVIYGCDTHLDTTFQITPTPYKTKNIVVVMIDGARYSETWGHPEKAYIPNQASKLATKGIINQEFYNFGNTQTISGHTATITGVYELMNNNGLQYPSYPSFMQYWLAATQNPPEKAWIITAKEKLSVLANSSNVDWRNSFLPLVDALDRLDVDTYQRIKEVMTHEQPNLLFINLSGPDLAGHQNNWESYLQNILIADSLLNKIVTLVDSLPHYRNQTTLFMTNDHGRHLDGIASGFKDHGDLCHGCTHINFFAYGPDFHSNLIIRNQLREQIDIVPTIGVLLGFKTKQTTGNVMTELFK